MTHDAQKKMIKEVDIYTDGSCLGNPGIGGWGAIIQYNDEEETLRGGEIDTTNNRMEMTAIISALAWCDKNFLQESHVTILKIRVFSDSNLIIQTLEQNWKRNKNIDLWHEMDKNVHAIIATGSTIKWNWVKAHATNVMNNRVDKVALGAAVKIKNSR